MRNQQSETGQLSLLAHEFLTKLVNNSVTIAESLGPPRTEKQSGSEVKALFRRSDQLPSKVAAEKTKEFRVRHMSRIYCALKDFGPMTYKEIALRIGMESVAVARRRKEMEENRIIRVLSETRNGCALWEAV